MTIANGTILGRYEIRSLIGVGGMGEVYRASDPKIGRDVAIKVLPADFSADKERVARFEQEAQAAGALNHPNILAIYDVDTQEGVLYVVSELLEGEELRARLNDGAISLRKIIEYAQQIVSGLSAAHEKGIVHRDLKPENLFITNDDRVKILDFGLAKLREPKPDASSSEDATRRAITNPGVVMGTVAYMSPEQVRGQAVDHRSDIFSFGLILYEMITGRRVFQEESLAETMSAIVKEEPPEMTESNPNISPSLERIVRRCLEKKPDRRFHSAHDLGFALESLTALSGARIGSGEAESALSLTRLPGSRSRSRLSTAVVGAIALAAIAAAVTWYVKPKPALPVRVLELPTSIAESNRVALSPDGTRVAYIRDTHLNVRSLDSLATQDLGPITTTAASTSARNVFWSPDSKTIGFSIDGEIRTIPAAGGPVFAVCKIPATGSAIAARWFRDGSIVFAVWRENVYAVPSSGGTPAVAFEIDPSSEIDVHHVSEVPNGRLIVEIHRRTGDRSITVLANRGAGSTGSRVVLNEDQTVHNVSYVDPGYLIFDREKTNLGLWAAAFTDGPLDVGKAILLQAGGRMADVANDGSLILELASDAKVTPVWLDRAGVVTAIAGVPIHVTRFGFDLSPDGRRLVMTLGGGEGGLVTSDDSSLVVRDLVTGTDTRLTIRPTQANVSTSNSLIDAPSWFPSGDRILFSAGEIEASRLQVQSASEVTAPRDFAPGMTFGRISHDGRFLAALQDDRGRIHLMYAPVTADGVVSEMRKVLPEEDPSVYEFDLSPDGGLITYEVRQDMSSQRSIFVSDFPNGHGQWQVAEDAVNPHFSPDGREVFYIKNGTDAKGQPTRTLMSRTISSKPTVVLGVATELFGGDSASLLYQYDFRVAPDGRRFLTLKDVAPAPGEGKRLLWIQNWLGALKK